MLQEALIDPQIDAFKVSKAFLTTDDNTDANRWPTAPTTRGVGTTRTRQPGVTRRQQTILVHGFKFNSLKSWKLRVKRDTSLF
ncbi:hypothetical protein CMK12_01800 [Candidatus Poribacteria bacterium]|nr:hypothetical protein [Candidatus Poribacteria bacterium]MDP6745794.1 hypothetical protein [Candidatus Poribacteria bacterium]MDP6995098.1 hypothetical protein [Candidatus Poribacteria bacterium]